MQEEIPDAQNAVHANYRRLELVSTKLRLLWDLGRKNDYYDLIEQYYRYSSDLCLSYARALKEGGELKQSVKVAEECLSLYPDYQMRPIREILK